MLVLAIFDKQTGARQSFPVSAKHPGSIQEDACKLLARDRFIDGSSRRNGWRPPAHRVLPSPLFRFTNDWATEDERHLLTISQVIGRRAVLIRWRDYNQNLLKSQAFALVLCDLHPGLCWSLLPPRVTQIQSICVSWQQSSLQIGVFALLREITAPLVGSP